MNGAATAHPEPVDAGPTVVQVNFGLRARHLVAGVTALTAALSAAAGAGWLVLPAKQSDLTRVEQSLDAIRQDIRGMGEASRALAETVERLQMVVTQMRDAPPKVVVRQPRPKPVPAAPRPVVAGP